jgi:hypothetical protein
MDVEIVGSIKNSLGILSPHTFEAVTEIYPEFLFMLIVSSCWLLSEIYQPEGTFHR